LTYIEQQIINQRYEYEINPSKSSAAGGDAGQQKLLSQTVK
jgi:hypothetical protein